MSARRLCSAASCGEPGGGRSRGARPGEGGSSPREKIKDGKEGVHPRAGDEEEEEEEEERIRVRKEAGQTNPWN